MKPEELNDIEFDLKNNRDDPIFRLDDTIIKIGAANEEIFSCTYTNRLFKGDSCINTDYEVSGIKRIPKSSFIFTGKEIFVSVDNMVKDFSTNNLLVSNESKIDFICINEFYLIILDKNFIRIFDIDKNFLCDIELKGVKVENLQIKSHYLFYIEDGCQIVRFNIIKRKMSQISLRMHKITDFKFLGDGKFLATTAKNKILFIENNQIENIIKIGKRIVDGFIVVNDLFVGYTGNILIIYKLSDIFNEKEVKEIFEKEYSEQINDICHDKNIIYIASGKEIFQHHL